MKINDILQRDPCTHPLVNQGQARIKILQSFLVNLTSTSPKAAWFSGFFDSGTSHLLKMACHLWQNTTFPDGATARSLVPSSMPDALRELLCALDTAGTHTGGLFAAAGSLPPLHGKGLPAQHEKSCFHALRCGEGEAAPAALRWTDTDK